MSALLEIPSLNFFAKGGNRGCYVDPRDPDRCLKVALEGRTPRLKRQQAPVWKRLRPLIYFDDVRREYKTYEAMEKMIGPSVYSHIPQCFGVFDTSLGPAICTGLIRDFDQTISQSMRAYLLKHGFTAELRDALKTLTKWMRRYGVPTRHLLVHNLVVKTDERGILKLYIIDGFGSSDLFPTVYLFPRLAIRKADRKVASFRNRLDLFMKRNDLIYHVDPTPAFV